MRTVALLVYPNHEIFALSDLVEPVEPPHSGYTDEENRLRTGYQQKVVEYKEKVKTAVKCNQEIAIQVLAEQFPDRDMNPTEMKHYNVKNILLSELLIKRRKIFTVGESATCVNAAALPGNEIGPPLEHGMLYPIIQIELDCEGNQHLDVGLKSEYTYVTSYETGGQLRDGDKIHWCHPTRFE